METHRTSGTLVFSPTAQDNPSGKTKRAVSANELTEHSDNKTDFFTYFDQL